ncbi:uncharacterized protein LOC109705761 isoform X2 [Ananas comosus]|uniref:Uncharacterized protein LOC109705761 isoform X2 n=1 Tax=Ananas comosus TaxID=4615 RepID=A0A6P5ELA0_ANACO|nr:uncharacterized protein LOC109705761 isoform X2 [Ananas comosus]XP_020082140.1 uncharacterized protein LOC109705761 isoform X2 [Ananas comosus]XP_020082141.1 uncharacterized protein LOC109705761 isoform X2 [Ananas comosus]
MCPNPFRSPCLSSPPPLLLYSSKTSARSARLDSRSRGRPQPSPGIHVDDTGLSVVHLLLLKITTIINIIEKKKIMDFGYPRNLWPEILKLYITQEGVRSPFLSKESKSKNIRFPAEEKQEHSLRLAIPN